MRIREAKYLARKIMESGEVPLLVGHFGVGKTDMVREIARETGRGLVILILSQMEPGDLIGLPSRGEDKTVFLKPDWWPEKDETIVLLDEINRAHRSIRNAVMQLLIDRRIHNHVLPSGAWLVAAMNPPDDEYDQADLITDPAFISRFFILEIDPNPEDWIEWARSSGLDEGVVGFIERYPEFLASGRGISLRAELKPSPRSWYKLARVLSNLSEDDRIEYGYILAAGIVGPEAAKAFYDSAIGVSRIPSAERVLVDGEIPERLGVDEANSLVVRIIDYLSKLDGKSLKRLEERVDSISANVSRLAEILPKESFYAILRFVVDSSERGGELGRFADELLSSLAGNVRIREMIETL